MRAGKQGKLSRANLGRQCKARTAAGQRCAGWARDKSDFCFAHDPSSAAARAAARLKGGLNRRTPARLSGDTPITIVTMSDVLALLNSIVIDTWQQDNGAARSRVLLSCCEVAIAVLKVGEFEQRIARLESLEALNRGNS